jgi:hypothetical protein
VRRAAAIACLCLAAPCVSTADESADARAARFFAAGLETPLLELRRGALLVDVCMHRLRRACTKEQRRLAAESRTLALLDELTLFPQRPPDVAGIGSAGALAQEIAAARAALMRAANDYDYRIIARYGAALRTCPGDSGPNYRESLDALVDVDLRGFQGLDGADYEAARRAIADAESQALTTLRELPMADCDAALAVGQLLMEMMTGKLEPWTREHRRVANPGPDFDFNAPVKPPAGAAPTRDLAISVAGNFVALVATELQLRVFPETAPRIKAIADDVARGAGSN